jgi:uncharacterized membrane protein
MNPAQLHIAINHFPVILSITGAFVLLYGLVRNNVPVRNTGLVIIFLAALLTVPTYLFGQAAEEMVEDLPGVNHDDIEMHENSAIITFSLLAVAGIAALISLLFRNRHSTAKNLSIFTLIITLVAFGSSAFTAHLGGQIRHPELKESFKE